MTRLRFVALWATALLLVPASASAGPDRPAHKKAQPTPRVTGAAGDASPSAGSPLDPLREQLEAIWSGRVLRRGTTAVLVVDAETGAPLFNVHREAQLNPASNVKLISTATVLDILGPDWRYQTRLLGASPDRDGAVVGGLYLLGNYDPTLPVAALREMATQLRARGVTRVDGDVRVSDDLYRDTLGTNRVKITVDATSGAKHADITVEPASDFIRVESAVSVRSKRRSRVRVRSDIVTDEAGNRTLLVKLSGQVRPGQRRVVRPTVRLRSTFTAHTLVAALREAGIEISGTARLDSLDGFVAHVADAGRLPVTLASHESRPMGELVARVNKRSLNHLADRLIMTAAAQKFGGEPSMDNAVRAMKDWLAGIGVDRDAIVVDTGSGLSYKTRITVEQIVRVLRAAGGYLPATTTVERAASFRESLSVGGVDGTLRRRFREPDLRGQVVGKTGTLTRVIALSGFVSDATGRTLCFSIVTNGHRHRTRNKVRQEHESLVAVLKDYLETAPVRPQEPAADIGHTIANSAPGTPTPSDDEAAVAPGDDAPNPAAGEQADGGEEPDPDSEGDEPIAADDE